MIRERNGVRAMVKKRKTRRRRRGGLGRPGLVRPLSVLLAAVAIVTALTLFFKVDKILVTGGGRYQSDEIAAATGVEHGDNLILLDKRGIAQRIYTALPYITDVRIHQQFPNTLLVEVAETQAAAVIQGEGGYWLLSSSGKVLELVEEPAAADYLPIHGLEAADPAVGRFLHLPEDAPISRDRLKELLGALEERGLLSRVDSIELSDPETLVLQYDGRFRVEMFYDADFGFKLHCLTEAVSRLEPNERGTIRMTMKNDSEVRFIPNLP